MSATHPAGGIAGIIVVICDAVRAMALNEDPEIGLDRLSEALAAMGRATDDDAAEDPEQGPFDNSLAAIRDLARAQDALLGENARHAEMLVNSAADRLAAAARALRRSRSGVVTNTVSNHAASVQLSVSEALRVPNEEAISDSLRNLMARNEAHAFVIFVDAHTGNFCQFIGSKNGPLVLDLPFTSLNDEEKDRARRYFSDEGYDDVEGREGFSVQVDRDLQAGTELALGTFTQVFRADPNFSLKIEEN